MEFTGSYEPPNMDTRNWTQAQANSSAYFAVVLVHEAVLVLRHPYINNCETSMYVCAQSCMCASMCVYAPMCVCEGGMCICLCMYSPVSASGRGIKTGKN